MLNYFAKIIVFIIITVVIISCSATKRVPQDEYLLSKNTIIVDDKKISNPDIISYLRQTPNTKILGIPISLHIYNFAKPDYEIKFQEWLDENPNKERKLINVFSKKQVKAMENAYNGVNAWFLKNGNEPVISDSTKINKSVISLTKYYQSKGFFDAEVSFKQIKKDNKKITVDYLVTKNNPYFIDSLATDISSPVLDSLYQLYRDKSLVVVGDQIDYTKFEKEEDRLVEIFRNSGVYDFGKNNMEYWIDTLGLSPYRTSVLLEIKDRVVEKNDSIYTEPFQIRKVSEINVFTDFSFITDKNKDPEDYPYSESFNGYNFYSNERLAYNPKYLANSIIIQKDSIYRDSEQQLTRAYLRELQNFKPSLDIRYKDNDDGSLTADVLLTPQKKYSFGFDNEYITSNIKPFGILGKVSWSNRNVFRGAEVLEISFQGSFLNVAREIADSDRFFNAYEIGSSTTLKFPRILFPINTRGIIPKRMAPKTNIELGIALQRNIGLDRQNITGGLNYTWKSSTTTDHKFELLNMQYIRNLRTDKYFTIYKSEAYKLDDIAEVIVPDTTYTNASGESITLIEDDGDLNSSNYLGYLLDAEQGFSVSNPTEYEEAEDVEERRSILTEDVLVPVMSYTYNYSNREGFSDNSFSGFTARLVSSGNLTSLFVKSPEEGNKKELFGLEIAQYLKTEVEYKKYWGINSKSTLVHRTFIGAAFPMGNSESIPFSRSYRAGGSNDIRAWNTFKLGPGSETNGLEFNVGSLKLTSNLEYRFQVVNNIYSALFIDAGNIWDITNSSITDSKAKFNGFSSLKDIAVGSGFGIRYDFSFLVLRLDAGFKTYEPYLDYSNKWFKNYNFGNAVYNIGINYPF